MASLLSSPHSTLLSSLKLARLVHRLVQSGVLRRGHGVKVKEGMPLKSLWPVTQVSVCGTDVQLELCDPFSVMQGEILGKEWFPGSSDNLVTIKSASRT